jgi:hypothetical protein
MRRQDRINNPERIDRDFIASEINNGSDVIIQFSEPKYSDKMLSEINDLCFEHNDRLRVRFYGFYSQGFDFKTLEKIPNIKSLLVDCLTKAQNLDSIKKLEHISRLSFGVFELEDTEILDSDNFKGLDELIITETKTKALNLDYLKDYKNLRYLLNGGHKKNIEAIGHLKKLEYLSFNSVSKAPIDYINGLENLKTLKFILGGRENIKELHGKGIEELEIIRVRGFNNFENICDFKDLKRLSIEDQIQLEQIKFDKPIKHLREFKLINCKTCKKLTGLSKLPELEQLVVYKTDIDFDTFITQPLPKKIKHFGFYTSRSKIDKEIKSKLLELGHTDGLE